MSTFNGLFFTDKGRALQAKAQAGGELHFNRIALGDGDLGNNTIADLNALIHEVKSLSITKLLVLTDNKTSVVGGVLSNQDVSTGFYWKELGVFAQDPDLGEILYCYGNAGALAEYIPAGGGADILEKEVDIETITDNDTSITASINQSLVYATQEALNQLSDEIDALPKSTTSSSEPTTYKANDLWNKIL